MSKFEPVAVKVGEKVTLEDGVAYDVKLPCEEKTNGCWFCSEHCERFDNQLQKDIHLGDQRHKKPCRLAWMCNKHGLEQP